MKTYNKYIALAALAISFSACEQEDFTPVMEDDAVKINATIGALQTRVSYDENNTYFDTGDQIRVQNTLRDKTKNIATYTFEADEYTWSATETLVWNSYSLNTFQAWYPATASYDAFELPTDQSDAAKLGAADWMTASEEEIDKPIDKILNLNFEHRLAKVTVNLTFASQYPEGSQTVSDFKFYTNEATQAAITPLAVGTSYTAILRPGEYADGTNFITLKMNGTDNLTVLGKTTLPDATSKSAISLEAGNHYIFTLKVGKEAANVNSVSVTRWVGKDIDGGEAEEITPSFSVSATKQVLFSLGNLQYTQSTDTWAFAENRVSPKELKKKQVVQQKN